MSISFGHEFDLTSQHISNIIIKENRNKDNCIILDSDSESKAYNSFILKLNRKSKTLCEVLFYKSSITNKYIPRLTFKRVGHDGEIDDSRSSLKVTIPFNDSDSAHIFWKLIAFLTSYKDLVDMGEFESIFKVVPKDSYILEFKDKSTRDKLEELKELHNLADLSYQDVKTLAFLTRKKNIRAFFWLLKNIAFENGESSLNRYRVKNNLRPGEEYIWHHFLKSNDWILGLNADLRFIVDLLPEQKIGQADSKGRTDPQTDLLGISEYTVLVELKTPNTSIFKPNKSKGRANTWDFSSDFIEAVSQALGQKTELEKSFESRQFVKSDNSILDKSKVRTIDPRTVLLIGNKKNEFPINQLDSDNFLKSNTLERFRRNNRNLDILTFDELFERAYHIVYSKRLSENWYWQDEKEIFN